MYEMLLCVSHGPNHPSTIDLRVLESRLETRQVATVKLHGRHGESQRPVEVRL